MSTNTPPRTPAADLLREVLLSPDFERATFGGPRRGESAAPWLRVVIRPVDIKRGRHLQFSYFDEKKNVVKNVAPEDLPGPLAELADAGFAGIHLSTGSEEIDLRTTKKGKLLVGRRPRAGSGHGPGRAAAHNRTKDLPLPEGQGDRLLEVMGILTREGRVRPAMQPKFTQINEFLRQLRNVLDDAGLGRPADGAPGRVVQIMDCGCGASYLTLAAHHFLNDVLAIPAKILGVDVNDEVIRKSVERSDRLGADGPAFRCGTISDQDIPADIVLALHACDTATDDAIAQAVRGGAAVFLGVPCCHHRLNESVKPDGPAAVLRPLLRHGILRERTADLLTDAFRALALRIMGFRTDVIEFVGTEHTARNLMLRAVRGPAAGEKRFVREYHDLKAFWGVTPYIEEALGDRVRALVGRTSNEPAEPAEPAEQGEPCPSST